MNNYIAKYMQNLKKEEIDNFAKKNNVFLSPSELDFVYQYVKKNWQEILKNPTNLHLDRYASNFSTNNYQKIQNLIPLYMQKYSSFLSMFQNMSK